MSGRIPITERAFQDWVQSVEDRLKAARRSIRGMPSSVAQLAVGRLVAGSVQVGDPTFVIVPIGEGYARVDGTLLQDAVGVTPDAATTPGACVGKIAVVDQNGVILGYLAVYATIT